MDPYATDQHTFTSLPFLTAASNSSSGHIKQRMPFIANDQLDMTVTDKRARMLARLALTSHTHTQDECNLTAAALGAH